MCCVRVLPAGLVEGEGRVPAKASLCLQTALCPRVSEIEGLTTPTATSPAPTPTTDSNSNCNNSRNNTNSNSTSSNTNHRQQPEQQQPEQQQPTTATDTTATTNNHHLGHLAKERVRDSWIGHVAVAARLSESEGTGVPGEALGRVAGQLSNLKTPTISYEFTKSRKSEELKYKPHGTHGRSWVI